MKILQLGKFYPIRGGVEKVMRDLTEGISARGIYCDMLCAALPQEKADSPIPVNPPYGRIIMVPALAKKAGTMIAPAMIGYLRKHQNEYDIIHIHHPDPMAALALRLSGFKGRVIVHWHSDILSQKRLFAFYRPLQDWLLQRCETIIGTTPVYLQKSAHLASFQDKCKAVPIGILPLQPNARKVEEFRSRFPGKTLVYSCGRLVPYKGMEYLVKAAAILPDNYQIVIGGEGPLYQQLEAKIQELNLVSRVTLVGYVPEEDISSWFGACDIFVLSSIMKTEAFGIVQIEAMSLGKPVVATAIPGSGVSWVNQEGISGKNAAPCDPQSLARTIIEVANRKVEFGAGAKGLFQQRYKLSTMIDKTIQIYETQINQ